MGIKYRPEIDGLRTLAVLSVVIYHAELFFRDRQLLPGGFLGVDIFFVISGFLITGLMLKEFQQNGSISLVRFYERRARRLLPALLVVMMVSLPFAWYALLPEPLIDYAKSLLASLFFASNFYWNHTLQQYGADSALLKPFLHTWSLAIEEQYYLIFPLLLLAVLKTFKKITVAVLMGGFFASLLYSEWKSGINASDSFYMLRSRFWELLAGGVLAAYTFSNATDIKQGRFYRSLPFIGLIMIVYSVIFIDFSRGHHPGFITLIPVLGTVLIIGFSNHQEPVGRVLSTRLFVALGLISYALYLWHYPIFAFGRLLVGSPSLLDKVFWILLTLMASVASYFLVEQPFRHSSRCSAKLFFTTVVGSAILISVLAATLIFKGGFPARLGHLNEVMANSKRTWVTQAGEMCHFEEGGRNPVPSVEESCVFKSGSDTASSEKAVILIGDSHAGSLASGIKRMSEQNGMTFVQITMSGCSHLAGLHANSTCIERGRELLDYLQQFPDSIIVFNARIPLYLERERFLNPEGWKEAGYKPVDFEAVQRAKPERTDSLVQSLNQLSTLTDKLVLVYPVPEQGFDVAFRLFLTKPQNSSDRSLPDLSTSYSVFKERVEDSYKALDRVDEKNIIRMYPEKVFCHETTGRCMVYENERIYFSSDNHLSSLGADLVVSQIAKTLGMKDVEPFPNK